jgi:uncharacterized delta-60 repeat protein
MKGKCVASAVLLLVLAVGTAQGQTLLTQTTWGGSGSDVAEGIATAPDGSAYVVGITDSFTTDQFGTPSPRIFLVKFAPNGSLVWQKIWNGTTIRGVGRTAVAVGTGGSVFVTGVSDNNGGDAVLVKFDANGTLLWERTWGGTAGDWGKSVATDVDGSVYIAGTQTSFGPSSFGAFVVKFDSAGNLVWQRFADGTDGNAVAVGPDGSVYATGTTPRIQIGDFDLFVMKITPAGTLVWQRNYSAGNVVDPRGGMTVAPDGSIVVAGAIQAPKAGITDLAALIVKLTPDGALVFDKQFVGKNSEEAKGVAVAPDDGTIYVTGSTTSFGAGSQDAFLLHLVPTGKKLLDAVTWGGTAFEEGGGGVAVSGGTVMISATTEAGPPYSLLAAAAKLSAPRSTLAVVAGALLGATGTTANPAAGVTTPNGTTIYSGNAEAAFVRILR